MGLAYAMRNENMLGWRGGDEWKGKDFCGCIIIVSTHKPILAKIVTAHKKRDA